MSATLTFANYSDQDWSSLDITSDWVSYRAFWSSVLQFATADEASEVYFRLDQGEDCLTVRVDGEKFAMEPPPVEFRQVLHTAACKIASGGTFAFLMRRCIRLFTRSCYIGDILLEAYQGTERWAVYWETYGVRMARKLSESCV